LLLLRFFIISAVAGAAAPVNIVVKPDLVREHFAGPGFQCEMFLDSAPKEYFDQVMAKRWRELNPGFARVMLHRDRVKDANALERLKEHPAQCYYAFTRTMCGSDRRLRVSSWMPGHGAMSREIIR
jgi:hypothetical protein